MHIKISGLNDLGGFNTKNAQPGEGTWILSSAALTSADPDFYGYIEQLTKLLLAPSGLMVNQVHRFLAVLHEDGTGDLFVNNFPVEVEFRAKRDIQKGQAVRERDIADIRQVRFPGVSFLETDKLVYVFKVGWRFGLVFDFGASGLGAQNPPDSTIPFDVDRVQTLIGTLFRYLSFFDVYQLLETETQQFNEMQDDGWFPFVETLQALSFECAGDFERQYNVLGGHEAKQAQASLGCCSGD